MPNEGVLPSQRMRGATTPSPVDRHLGGATRASGLYVPRYSHEDLDRLIDELRNTPAPSGGSGPYPATLVVASSEASDKAKAGADYVCDGTDDQDEINAALVAVGAHGFGTVLLSAGTFYLKSPIIFWNFDTSLSGPPGWIHHAFLRQDIGFSGTGLVNFASKQHNSLRYVTLLTYLGLGTKGCYGMGFQSVIADCAFYTENTAITLGGQKTVVERNFISSNGYGVLVASGTTEAVIRENVIQADVTTFDGIRAANLGELTIHNNRIAEWGQNGVSIDNCTDVVITDNRITDNSQSVSGLYDGIRLLDADDTTIVGNRIHSNLGGQRQGYGVNVSNAGCNRSLVTANHLFDSGVTGSFNDAGTNTNVVDAFMNYL